MGLKEDILKKILHRLVDHSTLNEADKAEAHDHIEAVSADTVTETPEGAQ